MESAWNNFWPTVSRATVGRFFNTVICPHCLCLHCPHCLSLLCWNLYYVIQALVLFHGFSVLKFSSLTSLFFYWENLLCIFGKQPRSFWAKTAFTFFFFHSIMVIWWINRIVILAALPFPTVGMKFLTVLNLGVFRLYWLWKLGWYTYLWYPR